MKKKFLKTVMVFAMPVVAFLTLAIFLVSGISNGLAFAVGGNGGGFFVHSNSKLELNGGTTISGNTATNGGGVYVESGGTFTFGKIYRIDADGNEDPNGDYVLFGSYPKTYQSDTSVITTTQDENGYYLGTDGNRYVKVASAKAYDSDSKFKDGTAIVSGTTYYFKIEPIKWRILKTENGKVLLLCEDIIDAHHFYSSTSDRTINGSTIYANNYKYSDIRAWLNGYGQEEGNTGGENWLGTGFLQKAFTTAEQNSILTTEVKNDASTTDSSSNSYASDEKTNDKIFLMSYQDMINTEYGFSSSNVNSSRIRKPTDYAGANNAAYYSDGSGEYWLRSPWSTSFTYAFDVRQNGKLSGFNDVDDSGIGVVPALYISESVLQDSTSSISGNTATSGNGHDVYNAGTFTMISGTIGTSENSQEGYGIFNEGTMNLFGGTIHDNIYSETSFVVKMGANIQGTITLSDSATITVPDYFGTTPNLKIILSDTREIGTILTLQGSEIEPNLENIVVSGYDDTRYEVASKLNEETGEWKIVLKEIITRYDENKNEDPEGKYVFFGSYPKTIKASDVTVDENDVDSNGYFLGSDGERYAKVANFSRPGNFFGIGFDDPDAHYVFSDGTAMTEGESYYFKVEPLKWKIMSEEDGKLLIFCDEIVDVHCFFHKLTYRKFNGDAQIVPNSYFFSDMRSWLNGYGSFVPDDEDDELGEDWSSGGFLQKAFSNVEQSFISFTENLTYSSGYGLCNDKIFLFSCANLTNTSYGFGGSTKVDDDSRIREATDFAIANGVFFVTATDDNSDEFAGKNLGCYWTSSACNEYDNYDNPSYVYGCHVVDFFGNMETEYSSNYYRTDRSDIGVVPALTINLKREKLSCGHFMKASTAEYVNILDENGETIGHQLKTTYYCSECENIDVELGEIEEHYITITNQKTVSDGASGHHNEKNLVCHTCGYAWVGIDKTVSHEMTTTSTKTVSDGVSGHHTETIKECSVCSYSTTTIGSTVSHSLTTTSSSTVSDGSSGHHTVTNKKCSSCSYTTTITGSTVSHSLTTTSSSTVSDGSSGHHTVTNKKCSSCSYTTTITGSTVSHSFTTTSSNTVSDGSSGHHTVTDKKCSSCSYTTTITGSTTDHSLSTTYSYMQFDETYHKRTAITKCSSCSYSSTSTKKMMHNLGADEICASCGYSPNLAFRSSSGCDNCSLGIADQDEFYDDKKKKVGENLFFEDRKNKGYFCFQLPKIGT